ncbi:lipase family protein [Nocardioides terrigena]|uniref:lipase family protein n=1 Tax=Nocardioides terrigena TaxID=424797 RepID=UPI000D313B46|nr:lipase family protein [Nocardioides terrigena]
MVGIVVGILAVALGATLVMRPFASLGVLVLLIVAALVLLGVGELAGESRPWRRSTLLTAGAWWAAALAILAWPDMSVRAVAIIVGATLVVEGVTTLVAGIRGVVDGRAAAIMRGASAILLGVLALSWPDVTVVVVAIVFGLRVVWFGVTLAWDAIFVSRRAPTTVEEGGGSRGWLRRSAALVASGVGLLVALALLGVSATLSAAAPTPDAFYEAPAEAPSEAGRLLRAEPFERTMPERARAWRTLYTTTRDEGRAAVASALVVVPETTPDAPLPVIAWAHGTTGAAEGCAPTIVGSGLESGAFFALDRVLANGWALVATDYVGLGTEGPHPYLIGEPEGRSVLDAVRAARELDGVDLSTDQTVVWGHSQGGHAALWTGILAPEYAPDASVIGVAAAAPASNLTGLVGNLEEIPGGALFASYVVEGYTETYDDVDAADYVRPSARIPVEELAARCLEEPGTMISVVESLLFDRSVFDRPLTEGPFGERLDENIARGPIEVPLLVAQGEDDQLVLPTAQAEYVEERCADGGQVEYRTYPGKDHVPLVEADSPYIDDLVAWTQDRLDGKPARSTC